MACVYPTRAALCTVDNTVSPRVVPWLAPLVTVQTHPESGQRGMCPFDLSTLDLWFSWHSLWPGRLPRLGCASGLGISLRPSPTLKLHVKGASPQPSLAS